MSSGFAGAHHSRSGYVVTAAADDSAGVDNACRKIVVSRSPAAVAKVRRVAATAKTNVAANVTMDRPDPMVERTGGEVPVSPVLPPARSGLGVAGSTDDKHGKIDLSVTCRGVEAGPSILRKAGGAHADNRVFLDGSAQTNTFCVDELGSRSAIRSSHA